MPNKLLTSGQRNMLLGAKRCVELRETGLPTAVALKQQRIPTRKLRIAQAHQLLHALSVTFRCTTVKRCPLLLSPAKMSMHRVR